LAINGYRLFRRDRQGKSSEGVALYIKKSSLAINGYRLFRRDRQGKSSEGVALYIKKSIRCEELSLKNSHKQVKSLWIRIRDRGNKENLVVGVYYRPSDQGELTDESCFLQLQGASCLQSLILLGDFHHPDIC